MEKMKLQAVLFSLGNVATIIIHTYTLELVSRGHKTGNENKFYKN